MSVASPCSRAVFWLDTKVVQWYSCDAEPQVLADYILALLKHSGEEADLRVMFIEQLHDFLEDGTLSLYFCIIESTHLTMFSCSLWYGRGTSLCRPPAGHDQDTVIPQTPRRFSLSIHHTPHKIRKRRWYSNSIRQPRQTPAFPFITKFELQLEFTETQTKFRR